MNSDKEKSLSLISHLVKKKKIEVDISRGLREDLKAMIVTLSANGELLKRLRPAKGG